MICKCCGKNEELRMGFCFNCVEMESVIAEGVDMFDTKIPENEGFSKHMNKLKYIIDRLSNK